ncbi:MAG: alpha-ribazole phosphatase [Desulfuromonadales bacterium]|jgi:alpha-ribazole phosphatase/probable phosphoglycerate mutase
MVTRTRIYLVRHGQVEGHQEKRYNGQTDVALTALGMQQYAALTERLREKRIGAIYSSDLSRCVIGSRMLAAPHRLQPVPCPALRELNMGQWEGTVWRDLKRLYPEQWQARLDDVVHYRAPGGENLLDVLDRVRPQIRRIVADHQGEDVVVVAHGGVNRLILLDAIGAPPDRLFSVEQNYGCLNIIDYFADGISVVKLVNGAVTDDP